MRACARVHVTAPAERGGPIPAGRRTLTSFRIYDRTGLPRDGLQRCSGSRVWRMAGRLTNVVSTSSTNSSSAALPLLDAQRIVSYLREA